MESYHWHYGTGLIKKVQKTILFLKLRKDETDKNVAKFTFRRTQERHIDKDTVELTIRDQYGLDLIFRLLHDIPGVYADDRRELAQLQEQLKRNSRLEKDISCYYAVWPRHKPLTAINAILLFVRQWLHRLWR
jgi:hypothetical protein